MDRRNRLWQFNGHWTRLVEQLRSRPGYSRSHWNIPMRRGHCKFYSKDRSAMENHCCSSYYPAYAVNGVGRQHTTFTSCQNAACSNEFFLQRIVYDWGNVHYFCPLFHSERSWLAYWFSAVYFWSDRFSLWCDSRAFSLTSFETQNSSLRLKNFVLPGSEWLKAIFFCL